VNDFQTAVATLLGAVLILLAVGLFLRKSAPSHSKFKMFGLEFESATPAVIVLVAGCGLLLGPAFTGRQPGGWPRFGNRGDDTVGSGSMSETSTSTRTAVVGNEVEPNNSVTEANQIRRGVTLRGSIGAEKDRNDFFVVRNSTASADSVRIILRKVSAGSQGVSMVSLTVWNEAEQQLAYEFGQDTISLSVPSLATYIVRIATYYDDGTQWEYELATG
jgi:hypothetical protein